MISKFSHVWVFFFISELKTRENCSRDKSIHFPNIYF